MRSPSRWRFEGTFSLPVVVDGHGVPIADVRMKRQHSEAWDNGKLLGAADQLYDRSLALIEELEALNIKTKAAVHLQELLLEINPRYRKA